MNAQDPQVGDRYIDRYGKIWHVVRRDKGSVGYNIWAPDTLGGGDLSLEFWRILSDGDQLRPMTADDVFKALEALVADFREREGLGGICALGCVERMSWEVAEAFGPER